MRAIVLISILALVAGTPAYSQQAAPSNTSEQPAALVAESAAPLAVPAPATTESAAELQSPPVFEVAQEANSVATARAISAQSALAIVGGLLIIVALISLLR